MRKLHVFGKIHISLGSLGTVCAILVGYLVLVWGLEDGWFLTEPFLSVLKSPLFVGVPTAILLLFISKLLDHAELRKSTEIYSSVIKADHLKLRDQLIKEVYRSNMKPQELINRVKKVLEEVKAGDEVAGQDSFEKLQLSEGEEKAINEFLQSRGADPDTEETKDTLNFKYKEYNISKILCSISIFHEEYAFREKCHNN